MPPTFIAGSGKVVAPGIVKYPGAELLRQLPGVVGRACVQDHDLVDQVGHRAQAGRQVALFVAHDHT
jgi:hypothetical protein